MTTNSNWDGVDVLIPQRFLEARRTAIAFESLGLFALIDALPVAPLSHQSSAAASHLADADLDECRAWITRVIRALPTQADMEANHG